MKAAVAFLDLSLHFESSQPKLTLFCLVKAGHSSITQFLLSLLFILLPCLCKIKPLALNANISHGKTMYIIWTTKRNESPMLKGHRDSLSEVQNMWKKKSRIAVTETMRHLMPRGSINGSTPWPFVDLKSYLVFLFLSIGDCNTNCRA